MNGPDTGHVVYFAGAGRYVKVGYSNQVLARMRDLQTANPMKIVLLHTVGYATEVEARSAERCWRGKLIAVGRPARGEWVELPLFDHRSLVPVVLSMDDIMALPPGSEEDLIREALERYGLYAPLGKHSNVQKSARRDATCNI